MEARDMRRNQIFFWLCTFLALCLFCKFFCNDFQADISARWKTTSIAPDALEHVLAPLTLIKTGHYGIPLNGELHPSRYLPWYPLLFLAPFQRFSESNGAVFGVWLGNLLLIVGLFAAVYIVTRKKSAAIFALFTLIFSDRLLLLTGIAMTEFPYIGFSCIVLLMFVRIYDRGKELSIWELELCGIAGALAGAMRSTGYLLLALPFFAILLRTPSWKMRIVRTLILGIWPIAIIGMTIFFNWAIFGTPLRSGYHYWCPVPYEIPGLTFNLRFLQKNLNQIVHQEWFRWAIIELVIILAWGMVRFRGKCVHHTTIDSSAMFAVFHAAILYGLYSAYFFYDDRFFLPGVITALPATFAILFVFAENILKKYTIDLKPRVPSFIPYTLCVVAIVLLFCALAHARQRIPMPSAATCALEEEILTTVDQIIPDNAVFLSPFLPVRTDYFINQGKHRIIVPYSRKTEYASKIIALEPVNLQKVFPLPDNPFDHLNPALLKSDGCRLAVPLTLDDGDDIVPRLLSMGKRVFVAISGTFSAPPFPIMQDLTLVPILAKPRFTILEIRKVAN